jgi:plasmid stabilization system protein ParE
MGAYSLIISATAEKHISQAFAWHEQQQANLGNRFELAIIKTVGQVQKNPLHFQVRYQNSKNQDIRIAFTLIFPYGIHFRIVNNTITVLAVFHAKQNSDRWFNT